MTLTAEHGTHYISRDPLATLPLPQPQDPRHYVRPFIEDVETVLDHFGSENGVYSSYTCAVPRKDMPPNTLVGGVLDGHEITGIPRAIEAVLPHEQHARVRGGCTGGVAGDVGPALKWQLGYHREVGGTACWRL